MSQKNPSKFEPQGLRNLKAYQLAKQMAHLTYDATGCLPKNEFKLIDQMRGATVSVFGNIAEGYGRSALGDYIRFCETARGSLAEVGSYIEFCRERKMLKGVDETRLLELYNHTWNTLGALIRSLKDKKLDGSWNRSYGVVKEEDEIYTIEPGPSPSDLPGSEE